MELDGTACTSRVRPPHCQQILAPLTAAGYGFSWPPKPTENASSQPCTDLLLLRVRQRRFRQSGRPTPAATDYAAVLATAGRHDSSTIALQQASAVVAIAGGQEGDAVSVGGA